MSGWLFGPRMVSVPCPWIVANGSPFTVTLRFADGVDPCTARVPKNRTVSPSSGSSTTRSTAWTICDAPSRIPTVYVRNWPVTLPMPATVTIVSPLSRR